MNMKTLVLAAIVASSASAQASYELLAICDAGGGAGNATPAVHRFDPVSRAYLGSFGAGILTNPWSVALNPSNGLAYVTEASNSLISVFNYSSGEFYGRFDPGWVTSSHSIVFKNNYLWATDYGYLNRGIWRVNPTTMSGVMFAPLTGLGSAAWIAKGNGNLLYTGQYVNGSTLDRLDAFNTVTSTWTTVKTGSVDSANFSDAVWVQNGSGTSSIYRTAAQGTDIDVHNLNGAGGYISNTKKLVTALQPSILGAALAHGGFYVCGSDQSDNVGGAVTFFDNYGTEAYTFGQNVLVNPRGMDTVLAPEPQEWMVLGLGLAAIVIRRRRKA